MEEESFILKSRHAGCLSLVSGSPAVSFRKLAARGKKSFSFSFTDSNTHQSCSNEQTNSSQWTPGPRHIICVWFVDSTARLLGAVGLEPEPGPDRQTARQTDGGSVCVSVCVREWWDLRAVCRGSVMCILLSVARQRVPGTGGGCRGSEELALAPPELTPELT